MTVLPSLPGRHPDVTHGCIAVRADRRDFDALAEIPGADTPSDPESEYVAYSPDSNTVALTLQENNAILTFDPRTSEMITGFTAGTVDLAGIDTEDDGAIDLTGSAQDVPREPDSIAWIDETHVATANEGDWKGGSRGWTIFDVTTGEPVWDAGSEFEYQAVELGLYPDDRSDNNGAEPEGLAYNTFQGVPYVFVAAERGNFVAVYDVSDPSEPEYVQTLPTTNGPEGLLPIPSRDLLAVSSEADSAEDLVRASVSLFELGKGKAEFPTIHSDRTDGVPIGWSALSGLSPDQADPDRLYTVTDAAFSPTRILGVDVGKKPALIDSELVITKDGEPYGLDAEGIFNRPEGGFWIANEGETGPENLLVRVDDQGAVQEEIGLPTKIADSLGKQGLEGVAAQTIDGVEQVWVALQRDLESEPGVARIGRYTPSTGDWAWFAYPLESTDAEGDWIGLSEIAIVDDHRLAIIERDKLNGPDAALKRITVIDIPSNEPGSDSLTSLNKATVVDVLPKLRATNGWTQEKLEGLTIGGSGEVYAVTDNDGVKDATGETVFLRLGTSAEVFGEVDQEPNPTPTAAPSPTESTTPTAEPPAATPTPPAGPEGTLPSTGAADLRLAVIIAVTGLLGGLILTGRSRAATRR